MDITRQQGKRFLKFCEVMSNAMHESEGRIPHLVLERSGERITDFTAVRVSECQTSEAIK